MDLRIGSEEWRAVDRWIRKLPPAGGKCWVAVAPGSKMPAKKWPPERFEEVLNSLIEKYDVWPVVFGGPEDQAAGEYLARKWRRGYVAAGQLTVRQGIAAMGRCALYLGNDTGTMHMAVAAGIPCVAVFSSRDFPGKWYPYGNGHVVLRTPIKCEGCRLEKCIENEMRCILSINTEKVISAAEELLAVRVSTRIMREHA
jgi:ADP-heptose:LPS heptosyltransferase